MEENLQTEQFQELDKEQLEAITGGLAGPDEGGIAEGNVPGGLVNGRQKTAFAFSTQLFHSGIRNGAVLPCNLTNTGNNLKQTASQPLNPIFKDGDGISKGWATPLTKVRAK